MLPLGVYAVTLEKDEKNGYYLGVKLHGRHQPHGHLLHSCNLKWKIDKVIFAALHGGYHLTKQKPKSTKPYAVFVDTPFKVEDIERSGNLPPPHLLLLQITSV